MIRVQPTVVDTYVLRTYGGHTSRDKCYPQEDWEDLSTFGSWCLHAKPYVGITSNGKLVLSRRPLRRGELVVKFTGTEVPIVLRPFGSPHGSIREIAEKCKVSGECALYQSDFTKGEVWSHLTQREDRPKCRTQELLLSPAIVRKQPLARNRPNLPQRTYGPTYLSMQQNWES